MLLFGDVDVRVRVVRAPEEDFADLVGFEAFPEVLGEVEVVACRRVADETGAVVLLKGPTTVIADPSGRVELVVAGDQRLATAGSGDVLSGIISALIAQGLSCFEAAVCGAHLHGAAARLGPAHGLIARDIADLIPVWWGLGPAGR